MPRTQDRTPTPRPTLGPLSESSRDPSYSSTLGCEYCYRALRLLQEGAHGHGPQSTSPLPGSFSRHGGVEAHSNIGESRRPDLPVYHTRAVSNNSMGSNYTPSTYLYGRNPASFTEPLDQPGSRARAPESHQPTFRLPLPLSRLRNEHLSTPLSNYLGSQPTTVEQSNPSSTLYRPSTLPLHTLQSANPLPPLRNPDIYAEFDHGTRSIPSYDQQQLPSFDDVVNDSALSTRSDHNGLWDELAWNGGHEALAELPVQLANDWGN